MSRGLHTDPYPVRAGRRTTAPFRRRVDEPRVTRRAARRGHAAAGPDAPSPGRGPVARVEVRLSRPRPGFLHPAGVDDIRRLLVIPDEEGGDPVGDWPMPGGRAEFARVELPVTGFAYRYRLLAGIVLAEAARQAGAGSAGRPVGPRGHRPGYASALALADPGDAGLVSVDELYRY